ncbi:MAG: hypothetical protein U1E73_11065 [Planctomycetota bacterium]
MTFLVVTPLGLRHRDDLLAALAARGIAVAVGDTIGPWSTAATWLYAKAQTAAGIALALRFETRWRALFPDDLAERWQLGDPDVHARLVLAKTDLRAAFPGVPLGDRRPGEPAFALHPFHVPDPGDVAVETRRLDAFVLTSAASIR